MIKVASRIEDVFDLLDSAEQTLFRISEHNPLQNSENIATLMQGTIKSLENTKKQDSGLIGVPSGFSELDRNILGWQPGVFCVVAARPGMGKTSFLLSLMRNAAVDHNMPVAMFSLEMSSLQLTRRLISQEAELKNERIKKGNLKDYEWQQLYHRTAKLAEAPIYINDVSALSLLELRAQCRRLKARHQIQLVVVDYLQLMRGDRSKQNLGKREQEIASISRGLKSLAKELEITVIAASQLSRAVETRGGDKRPQLSDLRGSGAIEEDVDLALFLYRPSYYGLTEDEQGNPTDQMAEVIIAKHRDGPTGKVNLRFDPMSTRFSDFHQQK